ncbi:RNA recognition motif domain-containing protein [Aeromonas caviae]|jgi:RNA recognition motif-containing protein|uniref:RNA-binding protein n=1 Tax=Aeromonas caviae TaxID=648 RepID=A0A2K0LJZ6_AERCA|nr:MULTISPECIES: RNA-binding protein [Aeromonas]PZQ93667.1 MAG: RNA-binding protein [Aeromonas media]ATP89097.1 RNA-binding protein [Aeromonas caviae]AUT42631.1 RNA-binding protein [Aeromonas sp. ASNIH5]AUU22780.1 RNA-binding protein [Aeromonas caviae]AUV14644.1 RNA-binding protein [Aeromonas sp. ASNIH3]
MNLSKFPVYVQAAVLALVLALLGYLVAQALQFSLKVEVIFAAGLAIGGFVVPLFLNRAPATALEQATSQETCTLYVGNLPYRANEIAVRELFAEQGQVLSVRLMKDKATGKRRGFGFVEMPVADAAKAIAALNDKEYQQRTLKVREANDKRDRDEKDVNDVDA